MADKPKALHAKQPEGRSKRVIGVVIGVALVFGIAAGIYAVTRPSSSSANGADASSVTPTTAVGALLSVQPPDGTTDVSPTTVVNVTATTGHMSSVTVAGSDGTTITGTMDPTGTSWVSSGSLALSTSYAVMVTATTPAGKSTGQVTHFMSLTPTATLSAAVTPAVGLTVGIGEPVVLRFNHAVSAADKVAILPLLHVAESNPVAGGWQWFSSTELHFRPEQYWPSGEHVAVTADLAGFDAGNGTWAISNAGTNFTVGDAHIATANTLTHQMTVTVNGAVVATYPISTGRTIYPTMNGVHIDLYRQYDVHMVSSTVGIPVNSANGYDEHVFWDVNISDGGEYVHAAPWDLGDQGRSNVSHGCINVSPANAEAFYNFSRIGDVIQVTGSPRPPSLGDHGTMDWNSPWSSWTPAVITTTSGAVASTDTTTTTTVTTVPTTSTTAPATPAVTAAPTTAPATTAPVTTTPTVSTTTTSTTAPKLYP